MKIAILGSGPTGLMAAWACTQMNHSPTIYSRKVISEIHGAQYLHRPIPEIPMEEPALIHYRMKGTPESYLNKVYGSAWDGTISDDLRDQTHLAWDMRGAYAWLWSLYEENIVDVTFRRESFRADYERLTEEHDIVLSTLPRPALCVGSHDFKATRIWAVGDAPSLGRLSPIRVPLGDIVYNGEKEPSWYRAANIYGYNTVEWPAHTQPPVEGAAQVHKPLSHNCDCWPDMVPVGRFGRWQNGKLVHDAFWDVYEAVTIKEIQQ